MRTETKLLLGLGVAGIGIAMLAGKREAAPSAPSGRGFGFLDKHSGKDYLRSLGESASPAREAGILDAVRRGFMIPITWREIPFERGDHQCSIFVASDSLRIGSGLGDAVRVSCSHKTAQQLADMLGAVLPTTLMSDAAWLASEVTLRPLPQPSDASMSRTSRMLQYSDAVDAAAASQSHEEGRLVRTTGKDWVTSERLLEANGSVARPKASTIGPSGSSEPASANFGWHLQGASSRSPGGQPVIQSVGLAHDWNHVDYSQTVQLVRGVCTVDGVSRRVEEVLRDPALAFLLSDEVRPGSAARVTRHPAVERIA